MKVVVGLGNPEKKYLNNRHNIGFMCLDNFAVANQITNFTKQSRFNADMADYKIQQGVALLVKPTSFMNNSGDTVRRLTDFYKLKPADLLVIYDDVDIEFGTVRTRRGGSSAGHNGVESIIKYTGQDFYRIRIGVANKQLPKIDTSAFVLSDFEPDETKNLPHIFDPVNHSIHEFLMDEFREDTIDCLPRVSF